MTVVFVFQFFIIVLIIFIVEVAAAVVLFVFEPLVRLFVITGYGFSHNFIENIYYSHTHLVTCLIYHVPG